MPAAKCLVSITYTFADAPIPGSCHLRTLENTEHFGIATTHDMTWKMVLDTYPCTECGRGNAYCPMLTNKPLSHQQG